MFIEIIFNDAVNIYIYIIHLLLIYVFYWNVVIIIQRIFTIEIRNPKCMIFYWIYLDLLRKLTL